MSQNIGCSVRNLADSVFFLNGVIGIRNMYTYLFLVGAGRSPRIKLPASSRTGISSRKHPAAIRPMRSWYIAAPAVKSAAPAKYRASDRRAAWASFLSASSFFICGERGKDWGCELIGDELSGAR
jgi:hypothetical protein